MIESKIYTCEICGTSYKMLPDAEECEKNHVIINSIIKCRYLPFKVDKAGVPQTIEVEANDGRKFKYHR